MVRKGRGVVQVRLHAGRRGSEWFASRLDHRGNCFSQPAGVAAQSTVSRVFRRRRPAGLGEDWR